MADDTRSPLPPWAQACRRIFRGLWAMWGFLLLYGWAVRGTGFLLGRDLHPLPADTPGRPVFVWVALALALVTAVTGLAWWWAATVDSSQPRRRHARGRRRASTRDSSARQVR